MRYSLIGLPGCGKTTVGKLLAKKTEYSFIDIVAELEERVKHDNAELLPLIDGYPTVYRDFASYHILSSLRQDNSFFALPGYSIYWRDTLELVRKKSMIIALEIPLDTWVKRLDNGSRYPLRELHKGMDFQQIYERRWKLCQKYAHRTIPSVDPHKTLEKIQQMITS